MNRKNLTAAVLAGLAGAAGIVGSAQAVNINPDGLGQVLIYPYYTVNGGNTTLLSVVNTTENAKAVKVRFKEGKNSREVLDFNLYLSAYDVWAAAIKNVDGTPTLRVADNSCTVPYLYMNEGSKQPFLVYGMNDLTDEDAFGSIDRAKEGYFEMIEMGTILSETTTAWAVTHVDGVPPYDDEDPDDYPCKTVVDAWTITNDLTGAGGYWIDADDGDPDHDLTLPSGGLFGGASIVNVQAGAMYSYDAKALNGFTDGRLLGTLHGEPGNSYPGLNSGNVEDAVVFTDDGQVFYSETFDRGVDAVSFVFMHDAIMNEYTTEAAVGAATEWVMTFPTKSFYTYAQESGSTPPVAPFVSSWDTDDEESCEPVILDTIYDRNEQTIPTFDPSGNPIPPIVSPLPPEATVTPDPYVPFELCYEVSVIEFGPGEGDATGVLGSVNFHNIDNETSLMFEHGWARLDMFNYKTDNDANGVPEDNQRLELGGLEGLPVTGFAVQAFQNAFLGDGADVLANYGGIFQHKATRSMGSLGGYGGLAIK
ncbi:MAG: hypothetical protein OQJ84_04150 [Xanthomonadales bacterium]|nr:hypothetical protein [Xanthomonadales bacterium]